MDFSDLRAFTTAVRPGSFFARKAALEGLLSGVTATRKHCCAPWRRILANRVLKGI